MYLNFISFFTILSTISCWNVTSYSNNSDFQYHSSKKFLDQLQIASNKTVIDIGCGNGKITNYISSLVKDGSVIGIDKDSSMIKYAKETYPNVDFKVMDIQNENIDKKYDIVVSFFCLPWIVNKQASFHHISNMMKSGSKLYILAAIMETNHVTLINNLMKKDHWKLFFVNYSSPFDYLNDIQYDIYANQSGIEQKEFKVYNIPYTFKDRQSLHKFNLAILPQLNQLSIEHREIFITELLNDYFSFIGSVNLTINFTMVKFIGCRV